MNYYCYLIVSNNISYIGVTNCLHRRLKQHNGILKGGAKATRKRNNWIYKRIVKFYNKSDALSFEWYVKHYKDKHEKWRRCSGLDKRLKRFDEVISHYKCEYVDIQKIENLMNC